MDSESRPRRPDHVLAQEASGSLVLLNPDNGQYYTLDEVGARVWELCDGRSVGEIVSVVCAEYDALAETVQTDVLELLADLTAERLLLDGDAAA